MKLDLPCNDVLVSNRFRPELAAHSQQEASARSRSVKSDDGQQAGWNG